jgi:enoyl-CoA hydratase
VSQQEPVLREDRGVVRILTLNRPEKLNAANLELQQRFLAELQAAGAEASLRALVITGAGRAFSAGGDRAVIEQIARNEFAERETFGRIYIDVVRAMLALAIPVVAAVNGPAVGWAAGICALSDIVVMAETAHLWDPHVRFGLPADPATLLMWPRLASEAVAKELLLTGRQVGAREAVALGLANRLVPEGEALATALEIAATFAALPPGGVAATKQAFGRGLVEEAERLMKRSATTY